VVRRHLALASGIAGGALIAAAGVLLVVGRPAARASGESWRCQVKPPYVHYESLFH